MDFYMYKYNCQRWYGVVTDVRHMTVNDKTTEEKVKKIATIHAKSLSGSQTCDVQLLQKYHMIVKPVKTYVSVTSLPFSNIVEQNTSTINDS
jgi:hypothetical protein